MMGDDMIMCEYTDPEGERCSSSLTDHYLIGPLMPGGFGNVKMLKGI